VRSMPKKGLNLSPSEKEALEKLRDTAPQPYIRERASAILKVGEGQSIRQVASSGLLRPRQADTVRRWISAYERERIEGLYQKPRRKKELTEEERKELEEVIHQSPENFGISRSRWRLKDIKEAISFLASYSLSGIWRLLRREKMNLKRGQEWITSPDLEYKKNWSG
jgi:transposase